MYRIFNILVLSIFFLPVANAESGTDESKKQEACSGILLASMFALGAENACNFRDGFSGKYNLFFINNGCQVPKKFGDIETAQSKINSNFQKEVKVKSRQVACKSFRKHYDLTDKSVKDLQSIVVAQSTIKTDQAEQQIVLAEDAAPQILPPQNNSKVGIISNDIWKDELLIVSNLTEKNVCQAIAIRASTLVDQAVASKKNGDEKDKHLMFKGATLALFSGKLTRSYSTDSNELQTTLRAENGIRKNLNDAEYSNSDIDWEIDNLENVAKEVNFKTESCRQSVIQAAPSTYRTKDEQYCYEISKVCSSHSQQCENTCNIQMRATRNYLR